MDVEAGHRDVPDRRPLAAHALVAFAAAARMSAHSVSQGVMSSTRILCGQFASAIAFEPVLKNEKLRAPWLTAWLIYSAEESLQRLGRVLNMAIA